MADFSFLESFEEFCGRYLTQSVGRWDGEPFTLEEFQREFFAEALACDEDGELLWDSVTCVMPRKNGKTTMLAALAVWRLQMAGSPEILLAASSDKQAGRLFDACAAFIRQSQELSLACRVRDHAGEVVREDGRGKIVRMSSDPKRLQGYNPSLVIMDEVGEWTTPQLVAAYAALTTAGGARSPQTFTITTAGAAVDRSDGILGRILDGALQAGTVVERPGLQIARLEAAKTLVWNYSAPTTDPGNVAAMKLANPASWITEKFLAQQAANPQLTRPQVLRYHGCVWTESVDAWITADWWAQCRVPGLVAQPGERVWVGVDVGMHHDATAVALAWKQPDGRVAVESKVWSAHPGAVADVLVPGGAMDLELVEDYIRALARTFKVQEVVYDPHFFDRSAKILERERFPIAELNQGSGNMAQAYQVFYDAVVEGRLAHGGGQVLTAHVMGAGAVMTERGWKVSKLRQSQRIDALVASVMAHWRAAIAVERKRTRVLASSPW